MPAEQLIFVGFELSDEMAAEFDDCRERDRVYLEDPAHLEVVAVNGRRYVGKRVRSGVAQDRLEDTARSVVSLIARVCGSAQLDPSRAILIAIEERQPSLGQVVLEA